MFLFFLFSCDISFSSKPSGKQRSGSEVYQTFCTHCHQENGRGVATLYPPLDESPWLKGDIPIKIILHGLKGPVEVAGFEYNNVMAPWEGVLSDKEIAGVIMFIRSSWNNTTLYDDEPPITESDVKEIRTKFKGSSNWTIEKILR